MHGASCIILSPLDQSNSLCVCLSFTSNIFYIQHLYAPRYRCSLNLYAGSPALNSPLFPQNCQLTLDCPNVQAGSSPCCHKVIAVGLNLIGDSVVGCKDRSLGGQCHLVASEAINSLSALIGGKRVPLLCGGMSVFEINDWACLGPHGVYVSYDVLS